MIDIVTPAIRSKMMAKIRAQNTRPEMAVRRALHAKGVRYRLHEKKLPGSPDIVLPKYCSVIFIHGCYWHRHEGCQYTTTPKTRPEFWAKKFADNVRRDRQNIADLQVMGWRVAVIWECAIKSQPNEIIANRVLCWLESSDPKLTIPDDLPSSAEYQ